MSLATGNRLGAYEIVALLGKGGMGEVWKARDPRLGRDVAIKVSAQQFTDCFEREARAIAALNHANICTLYDCPGQTTLRALQPQWLLGLTRAYGTFECKPFSCRAMKRVS